MRSLGGLVVVALRTLKDDVPLVVETSPDGLRAQIARFVDYYNRQRYHEALSLLTQRQTGGDPELGEL